MISTSKKARDDARAKGDSRGEEWWNIRLQEQQVRLQRRLEGKLPSLPPKRSRRKKQT